MTDCKTHFIYVGSKYINVAEILTITSQAGGDGGVTIALTGGSTVSSSETIVVKLPGPQGPAKRKIEPSDVMKMISQVTGCTYLPPKLPTITY